VSFCFFFFFLHVSRYSAPLQARSDLRAQFELYVPKMVEDPYSLDFLKKKRGPAAVATIPEQDLRTAVTALGWHTLTDAEVGG